MSKKRTEQFDPHAPAHGVPSHGNMDIGAVTPSGTSVNQSMQVVNAQLQYAENSRTIVDGFVKNAELLVKELQETKRELKRGQLDCALQKIYLDNSLDYAKCEPLWDEVIQNAKKDEEFVTLEGGAGAIDILASKRLTRYRETAIARARQLASESRVGILTNQITKLQNDLCINFATGVTAKTSEENARAVQETIKAYQDINLVLESKQADGTPVFSEIDKATVIGNTNNLLAENYIRQKAEKLKNLGEYDILIKNIGDNTLKLKFGELLGWQEGTRFFKENGERDEAFEKLMGEEHNFLEYSRDIKKSILNMLENKAKVFSKQTDTGIKRGLVEQTLRGEKYPDPGNATYKSAVAEYYTEFHRNTIVPLMDNIDNPLRFKNTADEIKSFIMKFRFMPAQMTDFLQSQFESGLPQATAMACEVADFVFSRQAGYVVHADPLYLKKGGMMLYGARLYANGISPEITQALVSQIKNVPIAVINERAKMFANPKKGIEQYGRDKLVEEYNGLVKEFSKAVTHRGMPTFPGIPPELERDFMLAYETGFESCGDMKSAADAAIAIVRKKWGVTNINNEVSISPYAIEDRLGNDIFDADATRRKAWEFACMHARLHNARLMPALEDVKIYPDKRTEEEVTRGDIPTYSISYKDAYGEEVSADDGEKAFRLSLYSGLSDGAKIKMGIAEVDLALQQNRRMIDKISATVREETRNEIMGLDKMAKANIRKSKAELELEKEPEEETEEQKKNNQKTDKQNEL